MMNLTAALNAARSSLAAKSVQTAIVAENIGNIDNPNFVHRQTESVSAGGFGVGRVSVTRADNSTLLREFLGVTSQTTEKQAILNGLTSLEATTGDPALEGSPAALMAKFQNSLQSYATLPNDPVVASNVVQSAVDLAASLNSASQTITQTRAQADADIGRSVDRVNNLLEQFHTANQAIVRGVGSASELAGHLDSRDAVLAKLSEEMDISTVTRSNNDVAIYAKGGAVLYEQRPRLVSFQATPTYSPSTVGNQVYIDGVPVTGDVITMGIGSGRLKGLVALRDDVSLTYQNQIDEIARGLIEAFAEQDQSASPSLPDVPGMFTYPGAPAIPASGVVVTGIAGQITVSTAVNPATGGDVNLIRDGGISGAAYNYNPTGNSGFADRLTQLFEGLNAPRSFDPSAQTEVTTSLTNFSSSSVSWFESTRARAVDDAGYQMALLARSSESLSRATGVDLDTELAKMMEIERSYEASARLLSTIDNMFSTLLNSV